MKWRRSDNHLHNVREKALLPAFQTLKAVFIEGNRIYEDAGFFEKTHIQICVQDVSCIKGVFRVSEEYLRAKPYEGSSSILDSVRPT